MIPKNINWIERKCFFDDLQTFRYVNRTDPRPYPMQNVGLANYRADERKRMWKRLKENIVFALKSVGFGAMLYGLLLAILLVL